MHTRKSKPNLKNDKSTSQANPGNIQIQTNSNTDTSTQFRKPDINNTAKAKLHTGTFKMQATHTSTQKHKKGTSNIQHIKNPHK